MEPITAALIGVAMDNTLPYLYEKLLDQTFDQTTEVHGMAQVIENALAEIALGLEDEDATSQWLMKMGLDRLTSERNDRLRRQVARGILSFTDPDSPPPENLVRALDWPRSQQEKLSLLLFEIRRGLVSLPLWKPLVDYANQTVMQENQRTMMAQLARLARLEKVFILTEEGEALRSVVTGRQMTAEDAALIEEKYRERLIAEHRIHYFRGITQTKSNLSLLLTDIYQELGLLTLNPRERRRVGDEQTYEEPAMDEQTRMMNHERRLSQRVTDALAEHQRLVILGEPGAGKTTSLRFVTLLSAYGDAIFRLGLATPYIPIMVRLADYAQALQQRPALALDRFLLEVIEQKSIIPGLEDYLHWALDQGGCMVLLDGLDEVGANPVEGRSLRSKVVDQVQLFGDLWCDSIQNPQRTNRLIITSRIEGYWEHDLRGTHHVELSPLRPPDEVEQFLLRWFTAYEQSHEKEHGMALDIGAAEQRAQAKVADLLPRIQGLISIRRLATNPLLLTILALIHENEGRLPNRRIELYETCAQTLIESWRQHQTGMSSDLLADLGSKAIIGIMAPLAYWLHEERPGGTASFEDWQTQLHRILMDQEGYEKKEATDITHRFLDFARSFAGLLAERGLGQFGFFHLTFEEYLAARQIARQRAKERRAMLLAHWEDPRWQEVILLAAGQLGIVQLNRDEAGDFITDLFCMEPTMPEHEGRPSLLAGRALADIGPRSVNRPVYQLIQNGLRDTMRDWDTQQEQPHAPPLIPLRTRYNCGEVLDELGWTAPDLNTWIRCPGCADDGRDLMVMKYPVTNGQFAHFVNGDGYTNPAYWGGEESDGWRWRLEGTARWDRKGPITQPEYWLDNRFGKERQGYPVVGVSWYEAMAYNAWLSQILERIRSGEAVDNSLATLVQDLATALSLEPQESAVSKIRLPTEEEWVQVAGGDDHKRFAWDPVDGPATDDDEMIRARANTDLSDLSGTSPVAMYPLGASQPYELMDMSGNVWEWTNSWYNEQENARVLRGGSWSPIQVGARVAGRYRKDREDSGYVVGFRSVFPIRS